MNGLFAFTSWGTWHVYAANASLWNRCSNALHQGLANHSPGPKPAHHLLSYCLQAKKEFYWGRLRTEGSMYTHCWFTLRHSEAHVTLWSNSLHAFTRAQSLSHVRLVVIPWTVARQAPLSMGFPRQEYRSGLPFPPPGDLPHPGIKPASPASPALQVGSLPLTPPGKHEEITLQSKILKMEKEMATHSRILPRKSHG